MFKGDELTFVFAGYLVSLIRIVTLMVIGFCEDINLGASLSAGLNLTTLGLMCLALTLTHLSLASKVLRQTIP